MAFLKGLSEARKKEILGVLLLALAFYIFLSLFTYNHTHDLKLIQKGVNLSQPGKAFSEKIENQGGLVGAFVSYGLYYFLGYSVLLFPLFLVLWGANKLFKIRIAFTLKKFLYFFIFLLLLGGLFSLSTAAQEKSFESNTITLGGWCATSLALLSLKLFGVAGSYTVGITFLIVLMIAITPLRMKHIILSFGLVFEAFKDLTQKLVEKRKMSKTRVTKQPEPEVELPVARVSEVKKEVITQKAPKQEKKEPEIKVTSERYQGEGYDFPDLVLLTDPPSVKPSVTQDELNQTAKALRDTLETFEVRIESEAIELFPGPVITRYEFKPAPGIKVNQVVGLADDLALALQARRIRIVAPVPGKAAIGVEIPNRSPQTVYLKEILSSPAFQNSSHKLALGLGKTTWGEPFVADLAMMPHLLIAGATGSGKSVCLNSIVTSLLYKLHPDEARFIMIDPKMLELTVYEGIAHLEKPVVTSPKLAERILNECVIEMEERYKKLAKAGVRSIEDYNKKRTPILPYLIITVDELADLMMASSTRIEALITRLAQMARAVGIHLILATQRPSVDVITGLIKANFSARIAFQVASKVDSRTILDVNGAEKLLGRGDMLFIQTGHPEAQRIHGSFISREETERIVEFLKGQTYRPEPLDILPDQDIKEMEASLEDESRDDLFSQAIELVIRHKQGSVSLLQRRLGIGYQRAARLIDQLEEEGIVGPYDGSKAREVLVGPAYLQDKEFLAKRNNRNKQR
jgi:S-DNA-T family DNA segregation ATPase FtsK/SpoIIIE